LWLTAAQDELVPDDDAEPLPGIGPLIGALEGFAEFLDIPYMRCCINEEQDVCVLLLTCRELTMRGHRV
jgi:hypothetical protein